MAVAGLRLGRLREGCGEAWRRPPDGILPTRKPFVRPNSTSRYKQALQQNGISSARPNRWGVRCAALAPGIVGVADCPRSERNRSSWQLKTRLPLKARFHAGRRPPPKRRAAHPMVPSANFPAARPVKLPAPGTAVKACGTASARKPSRGCPRLATWPLRSPPPRRASSSQIMHVVQGLFNQVRLRCMVVQHARYRRLYRLGRNASGAGARSRAPTSEPSAISARRQEGHPSGRSGSSRQGTHTQGCQRPDPQVTTGAVSVALAGLHDDSRRPSAHRAVNP